MIFSSIKHGFSQAWSHKRMLLVFYLANFLLAFVVMWPMRAMLKGFLGSSLMGAELAGQLNWDFVLEFFKEVSTAPNVFGSLVIVVPLIFWLITLFLSGGALAVFAMQEKYQPAFFWGSAASFFGRFVRLALWSIPVFAVLMCLQLLWPIVERIGFGSDPYQNVTYWGGWIKLGLRYLGIVLFFIVLDYARIYLVLHDEAKARIAIWEGIKFTIGNLGRTFALAFFLILIGLIALLLYNPIANALSAPSGLVIFLLFLVQQVYMLFRTLLKLASYAGQMHLYTGLTESEAATADEPDGEADLAGAPA
ncbi:MAG: hypothetical protein H6695_18870 [Deferribacteres bacterium]|nr:hypothetical protein [candidate division KSB1 bacterium]MCB9512249.1 hypothetical protein [Deferribacteres bacterium]